MAVVQLHLPHWALWFPVAAVDSYGSAVRNPEEHISVPRWVGEEVVEGLPPTSPVPAIQKSHGEIEKTPIFLGKNPLPVGKLVESHMVIVVHQNARISAFDASSTNHGESKKYIQ